MNRRTLLRRGALGLPLLAGCVSAPGGDGGTTVSLVGTDDPPDLPVRPSIGVSSSRATEDAPPRLRATVRNVADYPVEVGEERAIVFAFVNSEERPGVVLLPGSAGDYRAIREGCWRLAEPVAVPEYYGIVRLDPGESVSREVGVWGSPDGEGCLPTGRFRFVTTYAVARDATDDIDGPEERARWGFSIDIT